MTTHAAAASASRATGHSPARAGPSSGTTHVQMAATATARSPAITASSPAETMTRARDATAKASQRRVRII
ncbi:hypothetical protein [Microbacterium sp. SORGH_AS_0454]|uniref:hypothetical protein n=1 Tax=Microbacterium sp. SORGH_AS_0454 TaxID=3041758 RepID=UPI0028580656|nr:hypothetical protein [Microbacterium sp. SORGH_AS_0454]MDR6099595.1 hypothetical protein [Microbacterium sp. SORGH_AS_0454]